MKKWLSLALCAMLVFGSLATAVADEPKFIEVDYQTHFIQWDGVTTEDSFTEEEFAALTKTTVYQSDESPTGYEVTFRFYGPEYESVEVAGEWWYSEPRYSSQNSCAKIHPTQWYNGCIIHTDDTNPVRPYDQMTLNEETGYWTFTMPLASGTYCYQFRLDGETLISDPQNLPTEYRGKETYSQVLVPYDAEKQSLSPDYTKYQYNCEQHGTIQFTEVPSEAWGYDVPIGIYLPYGYDPDKAGGYKYLILSHGGAGIESNWPSQGMLGNITDNLIAEGLVEPMIVITPNMRDIDNNYISNTVHADGSLITPEEAEATAGSDNPLTPSLAQPFLLDELIPWLEAHLNVSTNPQDRALSGLSAGGMMTFSTYLNAPEAFGYFYCMSTASRSIQDYDLTREELKTPSINFGTGIFDRGLYQAINPVQTALAEAGISFTTFYTWGGHRWEPWRECYIDLCTNVLWK